MGLNEKVGPGDVVLTLLGVGIAAFVMMGGDSGIFVTAGIVLVALVLLEPVLIFLHELGHAVAATWLTGARVLIRMGDEPSMVRFAIGRIDVRYHPTGYVAHCASPFWQLPPRRIAVTALAGPAVSLAAAIVLGSLPLVIEGPADALRWTCWLASASSLLLCVANLVPNDPLPSWWPGSVSSDEGPSDGWIVLNAMRGGYEEAGAARRSANEQALKPFANQRARRIVGHAHEKARAAGHHEVGTEHLLLGILQEEDGAGARVLRSFGIDQLRVFEEMARLKGVGPPTVAPEIPFAPPTLRALRLGTGALTLRGDPEVDSEHLLLGVLQVPEGTAVALLDAAGVDVSELKRAALRPAVSKAAARAAP